MIFSSNFIILYFILFFIYAFFLVYLDQKEVIFKKNIIKNEITAIIEEYKKPGSLSHAHAIIPQISEKLIKITRNPYLRFLGICLCSYHNLIRERYLNQELDEIASKELSNHLSSQFDALKQSLNNQNYALYSDTVVSLFYTPLVYPPIPELKFDNMPFPIKPGTNSYNILNNTIKALEKHKDKKADSFLEEWLTSDIDMRMGFLFIILNRLINNLSNIRNIDKKNDSFKKLITVIPKIIKSKNHYECINILVFFCHETLPKKII